jgi:hypothetical protein
MQALSLVPHERPASGLSICMDVQMDMLSCSLPFVSHALWDAVIG